MQKESYSKAIELLSSKVLSDEIVKSNDPVLCFTYYSEYARALCFQGKHPEAFLKYLELIRILTNNRTPEKDSLLTLAYLNTGVLYDEFANPDSALFYYKKAIIQEKSNQKSNKIKIASIYNNIGIVLSRNMEYLKALRYFNHALKIFKNEKGYYDLLCKTYNNKGHVYLKLNEYEKALQSYQGTGNLILRGRIHKPLDIISHYLNMAEAYKYINKNETSLRYYLKALKISNQNLYPAHILYATIYNNIAVLYGQMNKWDLSLIFHEKALEIRKKIYGNRHHEVSNSYYNIGVNYFIQKKYNEALRFFQKSEQANYRSFAEEDMHKIASEKGVLSSPLMLDIIRAKSSCLEALYHQKKNINDLISAFEHDEKAISIFEELLQNQSEYNANLVNKYRPVFYACISKAFLLFRKFKNDLYKKKAFYYSEKSKNLYLISYQRFLQGKHTTKEYMHLVQQQKKEEQYLHFLNLQLITCENNLIRDAKKEEKLHEKIRNQSFIIDSLELFVKEKFPYKTGKLNENIPAFIQEIRKHLSSNEVLLEYSVSDRELFVFLITKRDFKFYGTNLNPRFKKNLNLVLKLLKSPADINYEQFIFLKDQCYLLYSCLIKPFYKEIKNKKLIIIPDEMLFELPFEVLLTEDTYLQRVEFNYLPYLILKHAVSYNYSANLFVETNRKDINSGRVHLLCFAPFVPLSDNDTYRKDLLPGSLREVNALKNILKTELYLDTLAGESIFKSKCNRRSIFHVATHGVVYERKPLYSHLVFYPDTRHEDGLLHVYELLDLHMEAPLVVLSACNSASSLKSKEIGLTGLTTAFIHAGVPALLTTLWNISDESTSDIIIRFYKHLARGLPKDEALQKAKLDYLYDADNFTAHPYFWAAYINIGSSQAIDLEKKRHLLLKMIFFAVLFTFVFIIFKRINRIFLFSDKKMKD